MKIFSFASIIWLAAGCFLAVSCNHTDSSSKDSKKGEEPVKFVEVPGSLPIPEVPAGMVTPEQRADFLSLHFWDAMQWQNPKQGGDTLFIEQSFANYIPVMSYATPEGVKAAVESLLNAAQKAGRDRLDLIWYVAEKYLYQADSPMRNEDVFIHFADWALPRRYQAERVTEIRKDILKNAPGTMAPDFSFRLTDGRTGRISDYRGRHLLIMFYEPDCQECLKAEKQMTESAELKQLLSSGQMQLLLVYIGDEEKLWREHARLLPSTWPVAIASPEEVDDLYNIRATPSFYLLKPDGRIRKKDAPLSSLL